jgi:AraC-like DNA-binding protein
LKRDDDFDVRTLAVTFRAGTALKAHRHRWGQLVFAVSGVMRVTADDTVWLIPPTRAIWIPAGILHGIAMQGDVAMRTLYIDSERAKSLSDMPHVLEVVPLLRELILYTLAIGMLARERTDHARISGLLIDLVHAARHEDLMLPLPRDHRALRVAEHWQAVPGDNRDLVHLAEEAGTSLRTLQRLFVSETGMTVEAWRRKARLAHAAGLLADGAKVTETALDCGYESVAAFSHAFREQFGISPGQYRVMR